MMVEMTIEEFERFMEDLYLSGCIKMAERDAHLGMVHTNREVISVSAELDGKQVISEVIYK